MGGASTATYRRFVFAACAGVGFVGMAAEVPALEVFAAAGCLLLLWAFALARRSLRGLELSREIYPSAFEGDTVSVTLVLDNRARRAVHLVELADAFGPGVAHRQLLLEPGPLRGRRRRRLMYRTSCSRSWGVYTVGPLSLRAADPMGLFAAGRVVLNVEPFAVYPRLCPIAGADRLEGRPTISPQPMTRDRPGQSLAYLGARDYRPGDELRRVHWPATARRGSPVVKEYEVDLVPYFSLFLDLERRHRAGTGRKSTLDYLVRTAASLAESSARRGDTVQAFGEGRRSLFVPPGRGDLHLAHALWELIRVRQDGVVSLFDVVLDHRLDLPEGSTAALLLGAISFDDAALEEALEALRARRVHPLAILVNEHSFLAIDRPALPPDDARARTRHLQALLRSHGVPGVVLHAEEDLEESLGRPDLLLESA